MVMIMVMIMMVVLKEVQALRFFEEKNTLRNNLFSMTRVIIDQQFFSTSITLLHNSLSWKPYWIVKNKATYILDFQFTIPHQNRDGKLAVLSDKRKNITFKKKAKKGRPLHLREFKLTSGLV